MDRRQEARVQGKLRCGLHVYGQLRRGRAWNFSPGGLFIGTRDATDESVQPGDAVIVRVAIEGGGHTLEALIRHEDRDHSGFNGGVGLQIQKAPDEWYALFATARSAEQPTAEPLRPLRFLARVHCAHCGLGGRKLWSGVCAWCIEES